MPSVDQGDRRLGDALARPQVVRERLSRQRFHIRLAHSSRLLSESVYAERTRGDVFLELRFAEVGEFQRHEAPRQLATYGANTSVCHHKGETDVFSLNE